MNFSEKYIFTKKEKEKPMHPKPITVWSGYWSSGIIGSFFFKNDEDSTVIVNAKFKLAKPKAKDMANIRFQ